MYVKKFESETLDGVLGDIKKELGPDAIILKTVTNKGLKGAFKKKKIEITAAVSEKNYAARTGSTDIQPSREKDDDPGEKSPDQNNWNDYGKIGLNKSVRTKTSSTFNDLDAFLNKDTPHQNTDGVSVSPAMDSIEESHELNQHSMPSEEFSRKIDNLEKKIFDLSKKVEDLSGRGPSGLNELRMVLKGLDIHEKYISKIIRKSIFELSRDELDDSEVIYEFTLREMLSKIKTAMPLFSGLDIGSSPVVTVLISKASCGQSNMIQKMAVLKENSVILSGDNSHASELVEKIYDVKSLNPSSHAQLISSIREAVEKGTNVFIDYKDVNEELDDSKMVIEGLKKIFDNVEVLCCISSIHSGTYNRKILSKYRSLVDGIVATNLDICLNYGELFNIACNFDEIPFKFFGTGPVIPDDIEAATGERIMSGLFQLN